MICFCEYLVTNSFFMLISEIVFPAFSSISKAFLMALQRLTLKSNFIQISTVENNSRLVSNYNFKHRGQLSA
ncbi:MAG: hypothetical protein JWQ54_4476 [Mucilaginibacter sp.]|nr:hypothetical protein [Mucilaginibacter sp.]